MIKICCTCKSLKLYFYKNKNNKDGLSNQCKECAKLYRDTHKDVKYPSKIDNSYYRLNKGKINSRRRLNYQKNIIEIRNKAKINYIKNKDRINNYSKKYYIGNKLRIRDKQKLYRRMNISAIYCRNRVRRHRICGVNIISQKMIDNLLIIFDNKCYYCKNVVERGINLHLDHKTPLSRGGFHMIENLVPSCNHCNLSKGTKTAEEFIQMKNSFKLEVK